MKKADQRQVIDEVLDAIAYSLINAPDYPTADKTSLETEFGAMRRGLDKVADFVGQSTSERWIKLAIQSLENALEAFRDRDIDKGCGELQRVEEYLGSLLSGKQMRADFVVGPSGDTSPEG